MVAKYVTIGMLFGFGGAALVAIGVFLMEDSRNGPLAKDIPIMAAGIWFLILVIPASAFGALLGGIFGASRLRRRRHEAMLQQLDEVDHDGNFNDEYGCSK
jgi:hypothetical protein